MRVQLNEFPQTEHTRVQTAPDQETERAQHPREAPSSLWLFPIPFTPKVTVILSWFLIE